MQDAPETTRAQYEPAEAEAIRAAFVATGAAECPRCRAPMLRRAIGGGSFGLGYARRREWMLCPRCRRSAIFDAARGTRT
jgi:transposase-like protein